MKQEKGKGYKSYAGDVPFNRKRTDNINARLAEMVENMTHNG